MISPLMLKAVSAFVAARRDKRGFSGYPGEKPACLSHAYEVQGGAIALWGESIAGWKVGRIVGDQEKLYGENRFLGPIFAGDVWQVASSEPATFPVIAGGSAALEAELIAKIELAQEDAGAKFTAAGVGRYVRSWHIGIEVAGSPLADIGYYGPLASIAAFGNNLGLLLGPEISPPVDVDSITCTTVIEGQEAGTQRAGALPGGPHEAIAFALNKLVELKHDIAGRMLISTGAITGVHNVRSDQHCLVQFSPGGTIECHTQTIT